MSKNKKDIIENEEEILKEPTKWWLYLIEYVVCYAITTGLVITALALRNTFNGGIDELTMYRYLADAFTIPGIAFICLDLIVLVARQGTFDGLLYALRHVGRMMIPFIVRNDITYQEFLDNKSEKRRGWNIVLCFFIVGMTSIIIAIIFVILFHSHGG